jgi:hypothetical protein
MLSYSHQLISALRRAGARLTRLTRKLRRIRRPNAGAGQAMLHRTARHGLRRGGAASAGLARDVASVPRAAAAPPLTSSLPLPAITERRAQRPEREERRRRAAAEQRPHSACDSKRTSKKTHAWRPVDEGTTSCTVGREWTHELAVCRLDPLRPCRCAARTRRGCVGSGAAAKTAAARCAPLGCASLSSSDDVSASAIFHAVRRPPQRWPAASTAVAGGAE